MAARKDEAVAVGPIGVGGVVAHDARPTGREPGAPGPWPCPGAGIGLAGGVHGQATDDVDAELLDRLRRFDRCLAGGASVMCANLHGLRDDPTNTIRRPQGAVADWPVCPVSWDRNLKRRPAAGGEGDDRRLAVGDQAAVRLHRAELPELELASYQTVGELPRFDVERGNVAGHLFAGLVPEHDLQRPLGGSWRRERMSTMRCGVIVTGGADGAGRENMAPWMSTA